MFELLMFHKAVLVQAKSTWVFPGWIREKSKLQITHSHPEAVHLLIF